MKIREIDGKIFNKMEWELNVISIQKNKALNKENTNYAWICNHLVFVLFHYYENCCNLLGKKKQKSFYENKLFDLWWLLNYIVNWRVRY